MYGATSATRFNSRSNAAQSDQLFERNPRRWSRQTRNWAPIAAVTLNPERDAVVQAALVQSQSNTQNRGAASTSIIMHCHAATRLTFIAMNRARTVPIQPTKSSVSE